MAAIQSSAILGMLGTSLSADEAAFFKELNPYGFILFARNCESPAQIRSLIDSLKNAVGREPLPILIDQEGGRVARLKPPHWPAFPTAEKLASIYRKDKEKAKQAVYLNARLIAAELTSLGITVNCAPLADLPVAGAHDIIGDRAFGRTPQQVIDLARAMASGLMDGGVVPVLKHIPGHGRANADSHEELPVVNESIETLRASDFVPFKALADLPMAMTAHVLYTAIDKERMATVSPVAIELIRNELGFNGLLMSDDLSMKAMKGSFAQRTKDTLAAGCDVVLHCNGNMDEMKSLAEGLAPLQGVALERGNKALAAIHAPKSLDLADAKSTRDQLLAEAA